MMEMRILRMRPITILKKDKLESQSGSRVGQIFQIFGCEVKKLEKKDQR